MSELHGHIEGNWLEEDLLGPDALPPRRRLRRPDPPSLVLNVTSMIDVIFLLLTYFMLTAQFRTREESFDIKAPERLERSSVATADPFELPVTPVIFTVSSKGDGRDEFSISADSPAFGQSIPSYEVLLQRALAARQNLLPPDQKFIIRPAADARWEHALGVLNSLKRAGFNNVRFANPGAK